MKPISHEDEDDSADPDDRDVTPTAIPSRPSPPLSRTSSNRPALVRAPPARLSDIPRSPPDAQGKVGEVVWRGSRDGIAMPQGSDGTTDDDTKDLKRRSSLPKQPSEEQVAKSRDAATARAHGQQRKRSSYGPTSSPGYMGSKRVSPIREEGSPMSSLNAAAAKKVLGEDVLASSASSTGSTESGKTVRGTTGVTPSEKPVRTPSYPFPYVPGTPRGWAAAFHQPFTSLSPTVAHDAAAETDTPGRSDSGLFSAGTTPGPSTATFLPPGMNAAAAEDPRYPTPNLYEMVLQLNAEPGLEAWWNTVTWLMHDQLKAERMSLVVPADPTDIENVPWGQKATFSINGPEEFVSHRMVLEQTSNALNPTVPGLLLREPSSEHTLDFDSLSIQPQRLRPKLDSRHSYAGPDATKQIQVEPRSGGRPMGPLRTATHASGMPIASSTMKAPTTRRLLSSSSIRQGSLSDPEFSSIGGGIDAGPYSEVFAVPRALDLETRPLIESGGVNRVLERGRVVTVTRDYLSDNSTSENSNNSTTAPSSPGTTKPRQNSKLFGEYRSLLAADNTPAAQRDYEEHEQYPVSPWAQSPAPSPAIQADEDVNPFFASESQQVEESFNPTTTPKDYSQFNQVEAIGIDRASTVLHIPLVHPTLSQPMQSLRLSSDKNSTRSDSQVERRAPIAILSILSSTVPYPHNLTHTLKMLAPHLATSYATSEQLSNNQAKVLSIRHRRSASGRAMPQSAMTIAPTTLDDLVNADFEDPPSSITGSITSPSDYSGRSAHSPGGSIVGTPGWDPSTYVWPTKSMSGTPGAHASEMFDNYFDAKKRQQHRSSSGASTSAQNTPTRPLKKSSNDTKSGGNNHDDARNPRGERLKTDQPAGTEKPPLRPLPAKDSSPSREPLSPVTKPPLRQSISQISDVQDRRHSQLHSYGADFPSSFGSLPSATAIEPRTVTLPTHNRKASYGGDMLPPSERLLRTIIDSLPVQIFTAEPDTGRLTWVNSKFLIYRGQDPQQVLKEPWQAIHPDDRDSYMDAWTRSLSTGQQLQQKVRLLRFDGHYRWFYVRAAPLKDKRQSIVHWIGTNMDFHEQHIAEANSAKQQETAASEAKYRALANSSPQIVFAVDRNTGVTFCNTQWLFYSGQTEAQALGVGFMDHVHPDDLVKCKLPTFDATTDRPKNVPTSVPFIPKRQTSASGGSSSGSSETEKGFSSSEGASPSTQMPQRKLSELATTGILKVTRDADGRPSYSTEVRLKSKSGEYRWHLVRVLLADSLLQGGGEEETWYGTCTDINDHKALERDLKETMDEKSRFLSNMSHEIRTPLNGITGMVNFLIDSSLTAEQMEHVNIIRASTEGLRGLINDILDLSKAEAGMIQLNMDWLHIRALIEEVNDLTSAMAIDKGLELNYLVEQDVPSQVKGDRFRLRQILLNIVGNAIKFTQRGEVFVRCSAHHDNDGSLATNERYIKFDVIDTGQGFTEKDAEYLFKRFSQIDGSSTRQHGGTGLGLVISRQLTQLHGGDMAAKGVPGKGATFTFYVKTTLPSKGDQPPAPPPTPGPASLASVPESPLSTGGVMPKLMKTPSFPPHIEEEVTGSPRFAPVRTSSPSAYLSSPDFGKESPADSSASSDPSLLSTQRTNSIRSNRSSVSSLSHEYLATQPSQMNLALPSNAKPRRADTTGSGGFHSSFSSTSGNSEDTIKPPLTPFPPDLGAVGAHFVPPMYSILVACPLKYSREATVHHIDKTLPKNIPHQITAQEDLEECHRMITGDDAVIFSHVVIVVKDVEDILALMNHIFCSTRHQHTTIVIITDFQQRRQLMEKEPEYEWQRTYGELIVTRRLRFVFKPLKPSRLAVIFDPQKEREMSTDRNHDSAQQVALNQKQVFEELSNRLGNKDKRVLLVEDNRVNQMVILKFLAKVSIKVETVLDGVQCTDKVFSQPHGHYAIILCDLHMPNKDGYQTCKEIRQWERDNTYRHSPIIALSANVLGDVYQKCIDAGFNSYLTKPVDFKELSTVLMDFMDPKDPNKEPELMKKKRPDRAQVR